MTQPETEPEAGMSNSTAESEPEPENWPEPGPRWQHAYQIWQWGWEFHIYFFATTYLAMGLYAGYYVIFNIYDGLNKKYLSVSLNVMVFVFGLSRAFVLFFDPYHQGNIIKALVLMRLIWSIGGPCLTAADSLVILALVETAQVSLAPPRVQSPTSISVVIIIHFLFVLLTDTVVSEYVQAKIMLLFCQIFFVVWGGVLGAGYFALGYKLDKKLFGHKLIKEKEDRIYIYLIYASGVANVVICLIMVYSAVGVFGVYSDVTFVEAWPWYTLQTVSRLSEAVSCILVFTVSAKRTRVKKAMEAYKISNSQHLDAEEAQANTTTRKGKLTKFSARLKKPHRINVSPAPNLLPKSSSRPQSFETLRSKFNLFLCSVQSHSIIDNNEFEHSLETKSVSSPSTLQSATSPCVPAPLNGQNLLSNQRNNEKSLLYDKSEANVIADEAVTNNNGICNFGFMSEEKKSTAYNKSGFERGHVLRLEVAPASQRSDKKTGNTKDVLNDFNTEFDTRPSEIKHSHFKRGLARQMSMFSILQQNKQEAAETVKPLEGEAMSNVRSSSSKRGRGRRMSMFSALHESKLSSSILRKHNRVLEISEEDSPMEGFN